MAVMTATAEGAAPLPKVEIPVLEFDEVQLAFAGVKAIDSVSFTVGGNELFAIIGPNGAGKTSIFNVLSGVYRPQSGRVTFAGTELIGKPPHEIAKLGIARTAVIQAGPDFRSIPTSGIPGNGLVAIIRRASLSADRSK